MLFHDIFDTCLPTQHSLYVTAVQAWHVWYVLACPVSAKCHCNASMTCTAHACLPGVCHTPLQFKYDMSGASRPEIPIPARFRPNAMPHQLPQARNARLSRPQDLLQVVPWAFHAVDWTQCLQASLGPLAGWGLGAGLAVHAPPAHPPITRLWHSLCCGCAPGLKVYTTATGQEGHIAWPLRCHSCLSLTCHTTFASLTDQWPTCVVPPTQSASISAPSKQRGYARNRVASRELSSLVLGSSGSIFSSGTSQATQRNGG